MYEATIEEPNVFTRPWKISFPLSRRMEKNIQLVDFNCTEFVLDLVYGQYSKYPESKLPWESKSIAGESRRVT